MTTQAPAPTQHTPDTVTAMLIAAGVPAARIRKVLPGASGAWGRPVPGQAWTIALDRAGTQNVDWSGFAKVIADGSLLIVWVKG